jgi:chromosome segregation ATPase
MKKWFFSNNGKVTAPLDLDAAKDYLANNPDVYGWHPSFNQWKPVNCISEFVDVLPPMVQPPSIPKEISDKFFAKKQRLESKLNSIDDSINHSQSSFKKFEQQIEDYKTLTQNLNDDVKGAISNIEKKYKSLSRKLSQVKEAVQIAENEMSEVVGDFDYRMSSNDIFMPSCNQSNRSTQETNNVLSESAKVSKAKRAQEKLATPHKRVEPVEEKIAESTTKKVVAEKEVKASSQSPLYDAYDTNHTAKEKVEPEAESANKMAKESFNGMKSMMKSVFKGDGKLTKTGKTDNVETVEVKKGKDEPLSMAERLKMAQSNQ